MFSSFSPRRLSEIAAEFPNLVPTFNALFEVFVLTVMDTSYEKGGGTAEFIDAGALPIGASKYILAALKKRFSFLRPQAVTIMDGWNFPDFLLNSVLGRYDGRVYEALYEQTRYEPLNDTDVSDGYYEHLQFLLHPERRFDVAKVQVKGSGKAKM